MFCSSCSVVFVGRSPLGSILGESGRAVTSKHVHQNVGSQPLFIFPCQSNGRVGHQRTASCATGHLIMSLFHQRKADVQWRGRSSHLQNETCLPFANIWTTIRPPEGHPASQTEIGGIWYLIEEHATAEQSIISARQMQIFQILWQNLKNAFKTSFKIRLSRSCSVLCVQWLLTMESKLVLWAPAEAEQWSTTKPK